MTYEAVADDAGSDYDDFGAGWKFAHLIAPYI